MRCRICGNEEATFTGFHEACFIERMSTLHSPEEVARMWIVACGEARERLEDEVRNKRWEQQESEARKKANQWSEDFFRNIFGSTFTNGTRSRGFHSSEYFSFKKQETVEGSVALQVTKSMMRKLLMLCHPDRHNNSETSSEVTRFLIERNKEFE